MLSCYNEIDSEFQVWFKNRRAKERKDAKTKTEEGQPSEIDKKDNENNKEAIGVEAKKSALHSIKNETEKREENPVKGGDQDDKQDENIKQSPGESRIDKEHNENKIRKQNEVCQKSLQAVPFTSKVGNCNPHKFLKKEEQFNYPPSSYSPRTISLKHYSKSYPSPSGTQDGMGDSNAGVSLKPKWENERQSVQDTTQIYGSSSHFPMTRLTSTVLPHYSNYVHQSTHADSLYDYPGSYPYRSFMPRHSSQWYAVTTKIEFVLKFNSLCQKEPTMAMRILFYKNCCCLHILGIC